MAKKQQQKNAKGEQRKNYKESSSRAAVCVHPRKAYLKVTGNALVKKKNKVGFFVGVKKYGFVSSSSKTDTSRLNRVFCDAVNSEQNALRVTEPFGMLY